jgi:uncharacterized protein (TIGR03435 family)
MLQAMLVDRCKLAVHREIKEVSIFALAVAKGGVKFKETDPTVEHPSGFKLPGGGVEVMNFSKDGLVGVSFYGITMAPLVSWLSGGGTPVQDKTGLTGKYDVVLKRVEMGPAAGEEGGASASDPVGANEWDIKSLGLELKPAKGQVETLVIDHMEKPTEN